MLQLERNTTVLILLVGLFSTLLHAGEQIALNESWQEYSNEGEPQAPWELHQVKDKLPDGQPDRDNIIVKDGWVEINNVGTEKHNYNPALIGNFNKENAVVKSVSFTYKIDKDYSDASQIMFSLTQDKRPLVRLVLGRNYVFKGIHNVFSKDHDIQDVGHRFSPGEEVEITLSNFDFQKKTFSLEWQSSTGKSGRKDGLKMADASAARVNKMAFGESSLEKSVSVLKVKNILVKVTDAPEALKAATTMQDTKGPIPAKRKMKAGSVAKSGKNGKPTIISGQLKGDRLRQNVPPDAWDLGTSGKAKLTVGTEKDQGFAQFDINGPEKTWVEVKGPYISLPTRDQFTKARMCKVTCEAKFNGFDDIANLAVQIRVKQGRKPDRMTRTRSASPHYTWEAAVEIGKARHHKTWDRFEGLVHLPQSASLIEPELRIICPKGPGTLWLRNVTVEEVYETAHVFSTKPKASNNIFFSDTGGIEVKFCNPEQVEKCQVELLDETNKSVSLYKGGPGTRQIDIHLEAKGYYQIKADAQYQDGTHIASATCAAVVGTPLAEDIRMTSRIGTMRVHGNGNLWKRSGANWDWACNGISLEQYKKGLDGQIVIPKDGRVYKDPKDYQTIMSLRGLPNWLYSKDRKRGKGLFLPKDLKTLEDLIAAFSKNSPELSCFTPFNEPNAHFRGSREEFVQLHKTIYAGAKRGNPNLKVYGPCLYNINMKEILKYDKLGLFDACDGFNMHAYVNGTQPEDDFINNIAGFGDFLRKKGKGDLPVYLTEFGWRNGGSDTWQKSVPSLTKAQYCARSLCLTSSQPIDGIMYFCFQIVSKDKEEGYSMIRSDGLPTPTYVAYVNAVKWLSKTKRNDGRWFKFSPKLHMVIFKGQPNDFGAAWCTEGKADLQLPAVPIRVEDMMGRPLPAGKTQTLSLSPSPTYFELPGKAGITAMAMQPVLTVTPGSSITLPWTGKFAAAEIKLDGEKASLEDKIKPGEYLVLGNNNGKWEGQPVKVISPIDFKSIDFLMNDHKLSASLKLQNNMARDEEINLQIVMENGNRVAKKVRLSKESKGDISIEIPGFEFGKRLRGTLSVSLAGPVVWNETRKFDQTIMQCPVVQTNKEGDVHLETVMPVNFSSWGPWPKRIEPEDCSASMKTAVSENGFYLQVAVQDNEHVQKESASGMWQEDSLQVAFDVDADKEWQPNNVGNGYNGHRIFEYGIALPDKGNKPMVWRYRADAPDFKANRTEPKVKASVTRNGTMTLYNIFFPWEVLALSKMPETGTSFGLALLVNDRDQMGGRHALRLFGGILENKNPESFGKLLIIDNQ